MISKYRRSLKIKYMAVIFLSAFCVFAAGEKTLYTVVDTSQVKCYNNEAQIAYPQKGKPFFGQDAEYRGKQACYRKNDDGTISDLNTNLMWTADPGNKLTFDQAIKGASECRTGNYDDWRLPTIKELYSLILFNGIEPAPEASYTSDLKPFIDTEYFPFKYGQAANNDRIIDSQYLSSTKYVSKTMHGDETVFGVNFADGRIKGYPILDSKTKTGKKYYAIYVRGGNADYGKNSFTDNGNGTITDNSTGLIWMKDDSKKGMNWEEALKYAENLEFGGYSDWRLPNIKELQSIVDYSRSPDTTNSPAINPIFNSTSIVNEGGKKDFPYYWSGTTHSSLKSEREAAYIAFGRALGWMKNPKTGEYQLLDVHGAGVQRSDPKSGFASQFPHGRGPQGDVIRIDNYVRCVRGGDDVLTVSVEVQKK